MTRTERQNCRQRLQTASCSVVCWVRRVVVVVFAALQLLTPSCNGRVLRAAAVQSDLLRTGVG